MITADPSFKFLGILSILIVWSGLLFLLYKWPSTKSMSFSLHAAQTRAGQIYYFFLFLITLPLFYLFVVKWYVPALDLPPAFTYLVIAGVLGQLLAVIVPAVEGTKEKIHNFGAFLMALTMIPLSVLVSFAEIPTFVKILAITSVVYMISSAILYFYVKSARANYLYFQAVYIALFHIVIITSTYSQ